MGDPFLFRFPKKNTHQGYFRNTSTSERIFHVQPSWERHLGHILRIWRGHKVITFKLSLFPVTFEFLSPRDFPFIPWEMETTLIRKVFRYDFLYALDFQHWQDKATFQQYPFLLFHLFNWQSEKLISLVVMVVLFFKSTDVAAGPKSNLLSMVLFL